MSTFQSWLDRYVTLQRQALESVDLHDVRKFVDLLRSAWRRRASIFVAGNGGSAANASHFAVDLGKSASNVLAKRFRVMSLTDNSPWITALANDESYSSIFSRQLENVASPGDLLILISVSGASPNLVNAARWARQSGLSTFALVGGNRGPIADLVDHAIVANDTHYGRVEDIQMTILHMACYAFIECEELRGE